MFPEGLNRGIDGQENRSRDPVACPVGGLCPSKGISGRVGQSKRLGGAFTQAFRFMIDNAHIMMLTVTCNHIANTALLMIGNAHKNFTTENAHKKFYDCFRSFPFSLDSTHLPMVRLLK